MRFIVDSVVGISFDDILSKIRNALAFMEKCEKDPTLVGSDAWSGDMRNLLDELSSLRTSVTYSTIRYAEYHQWQNFCTKAQFFTSRALRDHLLNRGATRNSVLALSCQRLLLDSMKDLKSTVEKIYLHAVSKLSVDSSSRKDILAESVHYLIRLVKIYCSRSSPENKVVLGKQLVFVEGLLSHTSSSCVMSEPAVPTTLLADTHAAIDIVMKMVSEFDSTHYLIACTDKCSIDLSANDYSSLYNNCLEVVNYIQFISLVIYSVVETGASSSWRDEVVDKFWDCIIDNMLHLLQQESSLIVSWKDELEVLHDEMSFLKYFLLEPPEGYTGAEHWNEILWRIKLQMCKQVTSLLYSFYDDTIGVSTFGQIKKSAELIKSLFIDDFQVPKFIGSNHLKMNDLRSFDSFQEKISILISNMSDLIPLCRTKQILDQLTTSAESLSRSAGQPTTMKDLWRQIWEMAYEMENILESFGARGSPVWHRMLWFFHIEEHIKLIEKGVNMISEVACIWDKNTGHIPNNTSGDEEVVGFLDEESKVVDCLVRGSKDMEIISIVGMPGLGKTTLAKKVYHNPTVRDYFNVCAWCSVSQVYQIKDLYLQILNHMILINEETLNTSEDELAEILFKALKKQKYLIVMDDIWENGSWHALRRSFPNDCTGSRVLLTSRFSYLNLQPESKIHPLRHLSDDECWELLQKKLYQRGNYPRELLEVGRRISIDCKGLPLAVVVVAGLLLDMNKDQWQKVASDVMSFIVHDSHNLCVGLLELSYTNLPYFLKPCFLYLGAFPNSEISVQKLIQLWISEGFIRRTDSKSLDIVAENYLMDLIRRNLVHVGKRRSLGGPKTCLIHDLVHNFCLTKGKEENFLQTDEGFTGERFICHRLSVHFNGGLISDKWSSYENALSLLIFSSFDTDVAMYILQNFKLLRVLDLMSPLIWHMIDLPDCIGSLVHLRYLAGKFSSVPDSICDLANLKTFHLVALTDTIYLPRKFYNLVKLQHLNINCATVVEETPFDYHWHFDDLQTLSTLLLSESDSTILRRFPNLRKLKCIFPNLKQTTSSRFKLFPVLDLLDHLESLEVTYLLGDWDELQPQPHMHQMFSFSSSIKKLTVKMFCLPWKNISIIGKLPNLEVLKLDRSAFVGEDWFTEGGMFNKLKYLRLRGLNIRKWHTSHDHFPLIDRLVVQGCEYLEEIPACFCDAFTLTMIEVSGCKISVEDSVRQIKEDQLDYGNEELKIRTRDNGDNKANIWRGIVRRRLQNEP